MIERSLWHPVSLSDLSGQATLPVRVLGEDVVLWRDAEDRLQALIDRCPHRGSRLSMGRVSDGCIECPYHGWRFQGDGRCIEIPALPGFAPADAHRARHVEVREQYDVVWVRLQGADASDGSSGSNGSNGSDSQVPAFAVETDARLRKVNCGPYDVQVSAPRVVENFLDLAHFAFVHEDWLGERGHSAIPDYRIETTDTGFRAVDCRAWQPRSSVHATSGSMVDYTYEVVAPYTAVLTKVPEPDKVSVEDFREAIALFVCPVEPELSRVWFRLAMNDFESSDERLQAFQNTIFSQDRPVLESQRPKRLPLDARAEAHSAADKGSAAYRRMLRQMNIGFGTC